MSRLLRSLLPVTIAFGHAREVVNPPAKTVVPIARVVEFVKPVVMARSHPPKGRIDIALDGPLAVSKVVQ